MRLRTLWKTRLSIYLSIYLLVFRSVRLFLVSYLSIYLSIYLSKGHSKCCKPHPDFRFVTHLSLYKDFTGTEIRTEIWICFSRIFKKWKCVATRKLFGETCLYDTNCIWWWGSNSGDFGDVEYPFLPLLPDPLSRGLVLTVRMLSIGQMELFKSYSYFEWTVNI